MFLQPLFRFWCRPRFPSICRSNLMKFIFPSSVPPSSRGAIPAFSRPVFFLVFSPVAFTSGSGKSAIVEALKMALWVVRGYKHVWHNKRFQKFSLRFMKQYVNFILNKNIKKNVFTLFPRCNPLTNRCDTQPFGNPFDTPTLTNSTHHHPSPGSGRSN